MTDMQPGFCDSRRSQVQIVSAYAVILFCKGCVIFQGVEDRNHCPVDEYQVYIVNVYHKDDV